MQDSQVGKSVEGPRIFAILQELLWHNCSPVCGSSVQQLFSEADGNLLQEDLCFRPHFPARLQPESLSLWQVTADLCLHRGHSKSGLVQSLWGLWVLVHTRFCLSSLSISGGYGVLIINEILPLLLSCWGFSFALGHGLPFFGGVQHSSVDGCPAASCSFGGLAG